MRAERGGLHPHLNGEEHARSNLPGNWLDTHGNISGAIVGRWYDCSDHPEPSLTRVKIAEIRDTCIPTRPLSVEERRAALLERSRGAQLRRRS